MARLCYRTSGQGVFKPMLKTSPHATTLHIPQASLYSMQRIYSDLLRRFASYRILFDCFPGLGVSVFGTSKEAS
eukprot:4361390-Pyramimonas_sp.AAC.1